jgi:tol-pal system-associated acyl-CoA thioesterase
MNEHVHKVQIYYEDTDLSGVVYHANYLRYFERAREHVIGAERLVKLLEEGVAFVVYKASLTYKEGARLGDIIEIRSTWVRESDYRVVFKQNVWKEGKLLVEGEVQMVTVDPNNKLTPLPQW